MTFHIGQIGEHVKTSSSRFKRVAGTVIAGAALAAATAVAMPGTASAINHVACGNRTDFVKLSGPSGSMCFANGGWTNINPPRTTSSFCPGNNNATVFFNDPNTGKVASITLNKRAACKRTVFVDTSQAPGLPFPMAPIKVHAVWIH